MIREDKLKKIKYPIAFLFFIIIFKEKFLEIISSVLITPLLATVSESNWLIELSLFLLSLGIIGWFIYKAIKGYRVSMLFISWTVALAAVYFYFRFVYSGFDYIKFQSKYLTNVALTDTICIVIIALILYGLLFKIMRDEERRVQKNKENKSIGFYTDIPVIIDEKENDIYKRYQYILELKDKILATKTSDSSFAIGIIGNWGSGKTTFINTLKGLFDKENDILQFKFNAWAASSPEKIIELFFSDLSSILSDFDGSLRNEIVEYFSSLVKSIDNRSVSFLKEFIKPEGNKTINQQYVSINNSIQKLGKKIIIYIDDVDRLNNKEIIEVLQLIRNTANFGNVYFIVAFERNYVLNAIKNSFVPFNGNYIEKIFQLEYYLPISHRGQILESTFYDHIDQCIDEKSKNLIEEMRNNEAGLFRPFEVKPDVIKYIKNMRDVKRLINVFNLNYDRIKGNVYLPDYISICLLRLKYPDIYHSLYYKKFEYLTTSSDGIFDQNPGELYVKFQEKVEMTNENSLLYKDIKQSIDNKLLDPSALEGCQLVYHLFNNFQNISFPPLRERTLDKKHLSITESSCFDRYFDFILEGRLDDNEFSDAITTDLNSFKEKIALWNTVRSSAADLQLRFENFTEFANKEQFELIINGIIYFTELPAAENSDYLNNFNINNFVEKIGGLDFDKDPIISKYYNQRVKFFKPFIEQIFDYKIHPFSNTFLFHLAEYIIKNSDNNFTLTNNELKEILKNAFIDNLQKESRFTNELMDYFAATVRIFADPNNTDIITPIGDGVIITEKFKNFIIEKGFVGFLKYNIFPYQGSEQLGCSLGKWPEIIFGTFENFYKELSEAKGLDAAKKEFDDFYKQRDDKGRVKKFEFNYLKKDAKA